MGDFTIQFGRLVAYRGSDTQSTIPGTVTVIGRRAFHFSSVTSVVLPDSVAEIEQEAFLHAKLEQVELGKGIKKIGANAFLCNPNVIRSLYPKVPISVFAKVDRPNAFYYFVHKVAQEGCAPGVHKKNVDFTRKHLLQEYGYKTLYIDVLAENYDLLTKVLSSGKISPKDMDALIAHFNTSNKPELTSLLLQCQSKS